MQLKKTLHPALDLSHSNPDFCHPKNAGRKFRFRKNSQRARNKEEPETLGKNLHASESLDQ
jgi:hypothetical protein